MSERTEQAQPQYPTLDEFVTMSRDDKLQLWMSLPISAQKLLVGISAFASNVSTAMAQPVSQTSDEEFKEAKRVLLDTPFFSQTETGRLDIVQPMRQFINTDLRKFWEEQKTREGK